MGDVMYALANLDFSDRVGLVISELTPEENDPILGTTNAFPMTSLPVEALETAIFGAA